MKTSLICNVIFSRSRRSCFGDIVREDEEFFEHIFYNGGTYWNEEVETNMESTNGGNQIV